MQRAALGAVGLGHWTYGTLPVPPDRVDVALAALRLAGFAGANVTIPHKQAALAAADVVTTAAREIGASNTLTVLPDGGLEADNTDAPGLMDALGSAGAGDRGDVGPGRTALVLGAGGSARACAWALREAGCSRVAVWNRTPERARALASDLGIDAVSTHVPADLLVNCTSVGLHDPRATFDLLPMGPDGTSDHGTVVDLVYRAGGTPLLQAASARGVRTVDGLSVLVAQGARSFERWTARPADRDVMDAAARG